MGQTTVGETAITRPGGCERGCRRIWYV